MAHSIPEVLKAFAAGEIVVVTDDDDREGEGDLIVAATLCTKPELTELTTAVLRDLRYPKVPESSSDDQDTLLIVSSFRSTIEEAIAKFATNSEITCEPADSVPSRHDTGSLSYCPRCLQEFSVSDAQCTMCGNRSAIPFAIE